MFFILPTIDKEFSALVTGRAFRLFKIFPSVCVFHFRYCRGCLLPDENFLRISTSFHVILTVSRGMPVTKTASVLFLKKIQLSSAENILQSSTQCKIFSLFSFCYEPLRKLLLGKSLSTSEILFGQGVTDASPSGDNSELSCHLSTSPNTQGMVSHRHKTLLSSRLFSPRSY